MVCFVFWVCVICALSMADIAVLNPEIFKDAVLCGSVKFLFPSSVCCFT